MLFVPGFVEEGDVEDAGEVLPELVARSHLQRLAVAHHCFAGPGGGGPREALALGLAPREDRDGQDVDHEVLVDVVRGSASAKSRASDSVCVGGVALLPQELRRPQEEAGAQLPAHDVGPLVDQEGEVPVALDPLGEVGVDDRLAGGAHHHGLVEQLAAPVGHDRQLGAEALDVRRLALEVALGDEQGEVGVGHARRLDAGVELGLHPLPDGVAVGADDHGAAHGPVVGQLRLGQDVLVPLGEVGRLGGEDASCGPWRPGCYGLGRATRCGRAQPRVRCHAPARDELGTDRHHVLRG